MTTPIGGASGAAQTTSSDGTGAAFAPNQLGEQAFLQLLIAELKNQDPNQPMDGQQMITQLAQLNQTQATMQSATYQQEGYASSLMGQSVTGSVNDKPFTGIVQGFTVNNDHVTLNVAGQAMDISTVNQVGTTISQAGTGTTPTGTTPTTGGQG
jgi:flagellar basal-body rod modification protein FlgD